MLNFPYSYNIKKKVKSFLGHASYYRNFIENFTKIGAPTFKLISKNFEFQWDNNCQFYFENLKSKLSTMPILRRPNRSILFHISTDAYDLTLGVFLGQKYNEIYYAIYFMSKNLTPT